MHFKRGLSVHKVCVSNRLLHDVLVFERLVLGISKRETGSALASNSFCQVFWGALILDYCFVCATILMSLLAYMYNS